MKFKVAMLAACAMLSVGAFASPVPFDKGATLVAPGNANREFASQNGELTVDFDPAKSDYIEIAFKQPGSLENFTHATVGMTFRLPENTPVSRMGLRLLDAKGETFQYTAQVKRAADGTAKAVWNITPETEFISWGANTDKKLDFPVRINAVSMDYRKPAPATQITLLAIDAATSVEVPDDALKVDLKPGMKKYVPGGGAPTDYTFNGEGVEIIWNPQDSKYIEMVFNRPLTLPEFNKLSVTAKFRPPAGCPVRSIGLRLTDKSNETFQFSRSVNFREGGIVEVTWDIAAGQWPNSWGGNNDKKLDQPMKIYGFGVDYAQEGTEAKFELLSVSAVLSGGETTRSTRPFYRFDMGDSFRRQWGAGELNQGMNALDVTNIKGELTLTERMGELRFFQSRPAKLILDAELNAGQVKIFWMFRDAKNQLLKTQELALKQGKNTLEFDLASALSAAQLPIRMERLVLINSGTPPGAVRLNSSSLVTEQPIIEALDFDIITGNAIHVLKHGEEPAFRLEFTNRANQNGKFNIDLSFRDFNGETQKERLSLPLKAGETGFAVPQWKPGSFGHWDVTAEISEANNPQMKNRVTKSFAYLKPSGPTPGRAPGFLFGVNSHTARWSVADQLKEVEAAALCGAKVVRDGVSWNGLQPARDVWNFRTMDFLVDAYEAVGIEHQVLFGFTAKWAAAPEKQQSKNWLDWNRSAPESDAWRNYVRTMLERYRGRVRYWEVWNEPDLGGFNQMSLDEYVNLQKITWDEAKKVTPEAIIMTGGFATMTDHPGKKTPTFHRDYLNQAKGHFEVHAYHEHGSFAQFADVVDNRFMPMRKETGTTIPWYANETAINSMNGSERAQAVTLYKKLLFAWARGSIGYTWYDLRNDGFDPLDGEHNYGMMTTDFYPKAVYSTYNMLTGAFMDMKYARQFEVGENYWAFEFNNGKETLIPAWDESGFGSALTLVLRSNASSASVIDLMGNESKTEILDGMTLLSLLPTPATLKLTGADSVEIAGKLLEVVAGGVAVPGRPFRFTARVFNPLKETKDFRLELSALPSAFQAKEPVRNITVPAEKSADVEFEIAVSKEYKPQYGKSDPIRMAYALQGTPWQGSMTVPVNAAVAVPAGADFNRAPDFRLREAGQVVSITAADPALAHRIWRGADDLSADVFLSFQNNVFRLKADVTDDKHSQPFEGFSVWKGDNIQFAFQLPGQQGYWEIGLSRLDSGKSEVFVFQTPRGFDAAKAAAEMKLATERNGVKTGYLLEIPAKTVGLTADAARQGFRFNLLVNDNDGEGRDGWIHIAPGIGENKNPEKFPFVIFE